MRIEIEQYGSGFFVDESTTVPVIFEFDCPDVLEEAPRNRSRPAVPIRAIWQNFISRRISFNGSPKSKTHYRRVFHMLRQLKVKITGRVTIVS